MIRAEVGRRDKLIDAHKSGSFKNSSEDGFSRPRIFQAIKVYLVNDRPGGLEDTQMWVRTLGSPAPAPRPAR